LGSLRALKEVSIMGPSNDEGRGELSRAVPARGAAEMVALKHQTVERLAFVVVIMGPLAAVVLAGWLAWGGSLHWQDLLVLATTYALTGLGITVGYHRLFCVLRPDGPPTMRTDLKRIAYPLDAAGPQPAARVIRDSLGAPGGKDRQRLTNSPWYAYSASLDDLVYAPVRDGTPQSSASLGTAATSYSTLVQDADGVPAIRSRLTDLGLRPRDRQ
jgi:hypothetical protein